MSDDVGIGMQSYTGGAVFRSDTPTTSCRLAISKMSVTNLRKPVAIWRWCTASSVMDSTSLLGLYYGRQLSDGVCCLDLRCRSGRSWRRSSRLSRSMSDRTSTGSKRSRRTRSDGRLWIPVVVGPTSVFVLYSIHSVVQNWGVHHPADGDGKTGALSFISRWFRSVAKLKKLQPEMARLKENMAMTASYRGDDGVVPQGADPIRAVPSVVQMPVSWRCSGRSGGVELRRRHLSAGSTTCQPSIPILSSILMGISMYITTALQPEPQTLCRRRSSRSCRCTLFFLWFPAGLVLYWVVNNVLSILQQWYVNRQIERRLERSVG